MGRGKTKAGGSMVAGLEVVRFLLRPNNRQLVLTALAVIAAIAGSVVAWQRFGQSATGSAEYEITSEKITVTPQPAWIHSNVKADVLRTAGIAQLNLLDRELVQQVREAFALHAWVAEVVRVEKRFPAQVIVELEYRRPVLVVKLDAPDEQGLLFLDEHAVLLPSSDFAPSQARNFLRIQSAGEIPTSVYGDPWRSERIVGAARVAGAWEERWQPLGLYWIVGTPSSTSGMNYELRTLDEKCRVVWGPADDSESTKGPTAEQKIAALEMYVHDKGPLDKSSGPVVIDLRELAQR